MLTNKSNEQGIGHGPGLETGLAKEILWGSLSPTGYFRIAVSFLSSLRFLLTNKTYQQGVSHGLDLETRDPCQGNVIGS